VILITVISTLAVFVPVYPLAPPGVAVTVYVVAPITAADTDIVIFPVPASKLIPAGNVPVVYLTLAPPGISPSTSTLPPVPNSAVVSS
jgi:hypothetical protein